jgi:Xaa-Pro dipeptidase
MRAYRLRRVKNEMEHNGVSAILALDGWNTQYLTGTTTPYWASGPVTGVRYALFPATLDEAILYEQGEIGYHARATCPWLTKVKVAITGSGVIGRTMGPNYSKVQTDKLIHQIIGDLEQSGLNPREEVLAIDVFDPIVLEAFQQAGVKVNPNGGSIMLEARKLKNQDEIGCIRAACAIGDAMFETLRQNLRPGIRENELLGLMHQRCYQLGGRIYNGVWLASGPAAWPVPRDESDRMIQPRDIVYSDVYNTSFMGFKLCYYRTFSAGKASPESKEDYQRALEWLYKAIDLVKPGVTTKELAEQWPPGPEIWKNIHIHYEDQTAGSNWGHGIGLGLYEPPIIWREASLSDPVPLEEGMTFAIETQHGRPGKHGVRIEEMVRVTKKGAEIMSLWPVEEITEVDQ